MISKLSETMTTRNTVQRRILLKGKHLINSAGLAHPDIRSYYT